METKIPSSNDNKPVTLSSRIQNLLDRYKWTYVLGWVFIAVIALVLKFVGPSLFQHLGSIVDLVAPTASLALKIALVLVLLVFIPLAAGWLARILLKLMHGRRNVEAMNTMQEKLFAEVSSDGSRGFPVVLVNYPNAGLRSLGVITSTFKESVGGRELASVYLPGTPDPTSGMLRVVATEDVTMTEWTIQNLMDFHVTFGSVCPDSC